MDIGAALFFAEYSISPTELAVALEERGFDSLWVAEHSHIPVARRWAELIGRLTAPTLPSPACGGGLFAEACP